MKDPEKSSARKKSRQIGARPRVPALSAKDMESIYALWDKLNEFSVEKTTDAIGCLALGMKDLLKADNVRWLAAIRVLQGAKAHEDSLLGWRLRASYDLVPDPPEYQKMIAWWFQRNTDIAADFQIGHATHAIIAGAGKFRTHRMRDGWIPFRKFSQTDHYRLHYTELGITDRMWVSFPLNADTESILLIDRSRARPHFSPRDAAVAAAVSRGIRGFHRRLFLYHGLQIGGNALSPVSRRIVEKLLTGMSEKEIAASLDQSVATTHKYITGIYTKFGVKSRAALMALWLGT